MATVEMATEPQHMVALRRANEVRLAAVALKREMRGGQLALPAAMEDDRAWPIEIVDLVAAQPGRGPIGAARALRRIGILENVRVETLTARQRGAIVEACS